MGKGDKKTRRGKIIIGSHGARRPSKSKTEHSVVAVQEIAEPETVIKTTPKKPAKKAVSAAKNEKT
jgi:30S ribosomal protein S31